jgi:predicted SAM-dependent methyltransferase
MKYFNQNKVAVINCKHYIQHCTFRYLWISLCQKLTMCRPVLSINGYIHRNGKGLKFINITRWLKKGNQIRNQYPSIIQIYEKRRKFNLSQLWKVSVEKGDIHWRNGHCGFLWQPHTDDYEVLPATQDACKTLHKHSINNVVQSEREAVPCFSNEKIRQTENDIKLLEF